jgi:hypothetical protein
MAQQLYFSRDTRMFVQFRNTTDSTENAADLGKGALWEIPVLDGYSFSQSTNTSEIALSEMESSAGISRRGRRMFTDSLAPAEWSFSTYARPFKSLAGSVASGTQAADASAEVHAVEEVLWASMFGADKVLDYNFVRNVQPVGGANATVLTAGSTSSILGVSESNRSALHSFTLYFLIDTATDAPLLYRLPEAIVNEASVDFDVDGIATISWSGFAKEIQDNSAKLGVATTATPATNTGRKGGGAMVLGDLVINTGNTRSVHIVNTATGGSNVVATQAIDEAITSTSNFIRNRLTGVTIESGETGGTDKVAGVFPGQHAVISGVNLSTDTVTTSTAHNFTAGDQVYITGVSGTTMLNGTHHYAGALASTTFKLYTTYAKAITGAATGESDAPVVLTGNYSSSTGTAANGKYSLTLTGGSFNLGNNITYLVPEELGAINKPLEHVTGTRTATGNATCYLTLDDDADYGSTNGTSRQFFNDLVGTGAMSKVVNKFKVTMDIGGTAAAADAVNPALSIIFPTAHIEVPSHSIEDVISLETNFTALPTDFGAADEITSITYVPPATY